MSGALLNIDLANMAIDIERNGAAFYDIMARSSDAAPVREIFHYLVEMERRHMQIIQEIFSGVDKNDPIGYDEERSAYVKTLMENSVFTDDFVNNEFVNRIENDIQALELSIIAEKDSIIFYYELLGLVPESNRELVNRIIAEEKSQIKQLTALKKELKAGDKSYIKKDNSGGKDDGNSTDST